MFLVKCLSCPLCGSSLAKDGGVFVCGGCKAEFPEKDGKVFFADSPSDVAVNNTENPDNQKKWTPFRKAQHRFVFRELSRVSENFAICDLGAGPSQSYEVFSKFPNYIGVDFYPYSRVSVVADIEKRLPFLNDSFERVLALSTFEHIHKVHDLLSEIFRILKPGGALIASTPFLLGIHQAPYDFHRFTKYELEKMLIDAGFKDVKIVSLASTYEWYWTSQIHFFMKLFDAARAVPSPLKSFLLRLSVKIVWNIQKYFTRFTRPLLSLNRDDANTLGYGFVAYKS